MDIRLYDYSKNGNKLKYNNNAFVDFKGLHVPDDVEYSYQLDSETGGYVITSNYSELSDFEVYGIVDKDGNESAPYLLPNEPADGIPYYINDGHIYPNTRFPLSSYFEDNDFKIRVTSVSTDSNNPYCKHLDISLPRLSQVGFITNANETYSETIKANTTQFFEIEKSDLGDFGVGFIDIVTTNDEDLTYRILYSLKEDDNTNILDTINRTNDLLYGEFSVSAQNTNYKKILNRLDSEKVFVKILNESSSDISFDIKVTPLKYFSIDKNIHVNVTFEYINSEDNGKDVNYYFYGTNPSYLLSKDMASMNYTFEANRYSNTEGYGAYTYGVYYPASMYLYDEVQTPYVERRVSYSYSTTNTGINAIVQKYSYNGQIPMSSVSFSYLFCELPNQYNMPYTVYKYTVYNSNSSAETSSLLESSGYNELRQSGDCQ